MTVACLSQAQWGGAGVWLRIRWEVKDRWATNSDGRDSRDDEFAEEALVQRMFAIDGDMEQRWLKGWLFDEDVLKPTVDSDLLDTGTWEWFRQCGVVFRHHLPVPEGDARVDFLADIPPDMAALVATPPGHCRVRGDRHLRYGDGGSTRLAFPLLFARDLGLSPARHAKLVQGLLSLASNTADFQPKAKHVQDIIDPDLCPQLVPDWRQQRAAEIRRQTTHQNSRPYNYYDLRHELKHLDNLPEHLALRKSYRWIPSRFVVNKDSTSGQWKVNIRCTKLNN